MTPHGRFVLACNELGWGDPDNGLWFIGIEEASTWNRGSEAGIESWYNHGKFFRSLEAEASPGLGNDGSERVTSHIDLFEARICAPLSARGARAGVGAYREEIWKAGSQVAHANLYPLGKPKADAVFPPQYEALFGYPPTSEGMARYRDDVRQWRIKRFQDARRAHNPQAIVCLGTEDRDLFREFLGLPDEGIEIEKGYIYIHESARVIRAPHWAHNWLPEFRTDKISSVLAQWEVRLP